MMTILGYFIFVIIFLDDILVFSHTIEEHIDHIRIVLERLRQINKTLNGRKCWILYSNVEYLGFVLR